MRQEKQSPFKFLDSYQEEDLDIFFGREEETEALYNALSGVKHLLVYGPSGAGKTSLIECGLRNQFSDADWFALTIRRGTNILESFYQKINEVLEDKIEVNKNTTFAEAIEEVFEEYFQPVYLLFDQFEELLLLGEKKEKQEFFIQLDSLIRYKVPCRVMLIMREEFIGNLSEFEALCPTIFQQRFRLEKMLRNNVQTMIQNILKAPAYANAFAVENPEFLAEKILEKLPDTRSEIELTHVQVFLDELWNRAVEEQGIKMPQLKVSLIQKNDELGNILSTFLEKQLQALDKEFGEQNTLELLASMISERFTKLQLDEKSLEDALKEKEIHLPESLSQLLEALEKRRIIRSLKAGEQTQYEISHDLLALAVGQSLTEEMKLREKARSIYQLFEERTEENLLAPNEIKQLSAYEQYLAYPPALKNLIKRSEQKIKEEQEAEIQKTQKQLQQTRLLLTGALIALVLAVVAGIFAWNQSRAAVEAKNDAVEAKKEADKERDYAKEQEQIAKEQEEKAKEQERIAKKALDDFKREQGITAELTTKNKAEKYNRLIAEAEKFQEEGDFQSAITNYELAKEFTDNPNKLDRAIENCRNASKNLKSFNGLISQGKQEVQKENYSQAINDYKEASKLGVNPIQVRTELTSLKSIIQEKMTEAQSQAEAFGFDEAKANTYREEVNQLNQYLNQIQTILTQL